MGRSSSIFVILMIIGSAIIMINGSERVSGDIITVSTDGTKMFTSIQDAVDSASPGDEIVVSSGIYTESLNVTTDNLTIRGQDPDTTFISSSSEIGILIVANNVTIDSINITNCLIGIVCSVVNDVRVMNCSINPSWWSGIVTGCERIVMENNTLNGKLQLIDTRYSYLYSNLFFNGGMEITGEDKSYWNSHSIGNSNKVNSRDLIYLNGLASSQLSFNAGQLIISDCTSVSFNQQLINNVEKGIQVGFSTMITITGCDINDTTTGIYLQDTTSSTIAQCGVEESSTGIDMLRSDWNWLADNEIANNIYGLKIADSNNNTVTDCNVTDNHGDGISIGTTPDLRESKDNLVQSSVITDNGDGVSILHSSFNRIYDCYIVSNDQNGILIDSSYYDYMATGNIVEECTIGGNENFGVATFYTTSTHIENCYVIGNLRGIVNEFCRDVDVSNNTFKSQDGTAVTSSGISKLFGNTFQRCWGGGARLYGIDNVSIKNNIFADDSGFFLRDSSNVSVFNNQFNDSILDLQGSWDLTIYNNEFVNGSSLDYVGGRILWNISKTSGTNIIGGPYLGGNYWSNYSGFDTDGDGIGDTNVPHGPGDNLPLQYDLVPPTIIDLTEGDPTTGDVFSILALPADERAEVFPYVEYWFGDDPEHSNETLQVCNPWGYDVRIPGDSLDSLHYKLSVMDTAGNWFSTQTITRQVSDNDEPYISLDVKDGNFFDEEEDIEYVAFGLDNVAMDSVRLNYVDVNGFHHNNSIMYSNPTVYTPPVVQIIPGQDSEGQMTLWIWAIDSSGNVNTTDPITLTILPNPDPVIDIISPENGSFIANWMDISVNATDIFESIYSVSIEVTELQTNGTIYSEFFNNVEDIISYSIDTSNWDAGDYKLKVVATDESNRSSIMEYFLHVDNIAPVADAGEDMIVFVDEKVILDAGASHDNWEGSPSRYEWRFTENDLPVIHSGSIPTASHVFQFTGTYLISLTVFDMAGNWNIDTINITVITPPFAPMILSTYPEDHAGDVSIYSNIRILFSEPMNITSVGSSIKIEPIESYRLEWSEDQTTLIMEMIEGFTYGTPYTITIDSALSSEGLKIDPAEFTLHFSTERSLVISVDQPVMGQKYQPGELITIRGTVEGSTSGMEITASIDGNTYSSITGFSGRFDISIMAPEMAGHYAIDISVSDRTYQTNIIVEEKEEKGSFDPLPLIAIILILLVIVVFFFILIRRGGKNHTSGPIEE